MACVQSISCAQYIGPYPDAELLTLNSCGVRSEHVLGIAESDNSGCNSVSGKAAFPSQVQWTATSPAKLNVFLEVMGKRADGYHELDTVMLRTQFADQLTVRKSANSTLSLRFSDSTPDQLREGVPLDERNLILRAAGKVRERLGITDGAEFILHKRIPPESGLGGGSSNAAAALLLCRQVWQADLSDEVLHQIASSLGSDINFLLSGHVAAICRGRGELIYPVVLRRPLWFVAVRPPTGNSTAEVFRRTALPDTLRSSQAVVDVLTGATEGSLSRLVFNRLTEAARQLNPAMSELLKDLARLTGRPAFMSGSGSTVFVQAESRRDSERMQAKLKSALRCAVWVLETARR